MATWSLVSTAQIALTPAGPLYDSTISTFTRVGFFQVRTGASGVIITQAPTFGGTQATMTFPITLDQARDLATALIKIVA